MNRSPNTLLGVVHEVKSRCIVEVRLVRGRGGVIGMGAVDEMMCSAVGLGGGKARKS